MRKQLFFIFLIVFLAVPIVAASDPTFQFNKAFDLKRACSDRGFFCDNNFVCNISIIYPDGNTLVNNQRMTNNESFRNISINQGANNQLGFLEAIQSCNNGTTAGTETFPIAITGDGKPFEVFPTQFVIIIFAFCFVVIGLFAEKLRIFKTLGSILVMVLGVLTLYPGYSFINYSTLLGQGLGFVLVGLGFYFLAIDGNFSRERQVDGFKQDDDGRFHGND